MENYIIDSDKDLMNELSLPLPLKNVNFNNRQELIARLSKSIKTIEEEVGVSFVQFEDIEIVEKKTDYSAPTAIELTQKAEIAKELNDFQHLEDILIEDWTSGN